MSDEPRWVIWRKNLETREREVYLETYATEAEAAARADELDDEKPGYLHWTAREDEWDVGALDRMRARIDADPASRAEVDRLKAQMEAELEDGGELDDPGGLDRVRRAFPGGRRGFADWLDHPRGELGGRTPRQALADGDVELVVAVAEHFAK
jgi:hypothetical protein